MNERKKAVKNKIKIDSEEIKAIYNRYKDIYHNAKKGDKKILYKNISNDYGLNLYYVASIFKTLSKEEIGERIADTDYHSKCVLNRMQKDKRNKIPDEKVRNVISEIYKEIYSKNPEEIKLNEILSIITVVIKPENIIFQFNELLLYNFNLFTTAIYRIMYNNPKVKKYILEKNKK